MKAWYFFKKSKTFGPIDLDEIFELIDLGDICTSDLLSFEKSDWKYAYEYEVIYDYFKSLNFKMDDHKKWIVMKFLKQGGRQQMGPWTTDMVNRALQSGKIHYQDIIWCSGMVEWYSIAMLAEFNQKKRVEFFQQETPPPRESLGAQAKPYLIMSRPEGKKAELLPSEAQGDDLVPPFI